MNGIVQRSVRYIAIVWASGAPSWTNSGEMKNPAAAATMSAPLRLSGRRCQAIRPHAANEPPSSRKAMS
jgi:hypothetical protein